MENTYQSLEFCWDRHWKGLANLLGWFQWFFFPPSVRSPTSPCIWLLEYIFVSFDQNRNWITLKNICCLWSSTVFSHILVCPQKLKMQFWSFERKKFHLNYLMDLYSYLQQRSLLLICYTAVSACCSQYTELAAANFSSVSKISGLLKYNYSLSEEQNFEFALLLISTVQRPWATAGQAVNPGVNLFLYISVSTNRLFSGFMLVPCQNVVIALAISVLSFWLNMLLKQSDNVLIDQEHNLIFFSPGSDYSYWDYNWNCKPRASNECNLFAFNSVHPLEKSKNVQKVRKPCACILTVN